MRFALEDRHWQHFRYCSLEMKTGGGIPVRDFGVFLSECVLWRLFGSSGMTIVSPYYMILGLYFPTSAERAGRSLQDNYQPVEAAIQVRDPSQNHVPCC